MKNTKRILSVLLTVALLFTMVTVASAAENSTITLSDIDPNTVVGKAVDKLISVGIINGYEDGTYRPDNTITRAEFAKVIATFLGLAEFASDTQPSGFPDVDGTGHWAQKYIKLAVDKGIVLGYEDGTFRPDNPVKYSEAIKMVVCALGYGDVASRRTVEGTPWYSGYVTLAGELKLLVNTAINNYEDEASRGNVAIIVYNALSAKVANTTTSSTGKTTTTDSGKTAEQTFLNTKDMKGIVISCYQTSLSKASSGNKERFINVDEGDEVRKYRVPEGTDTYALLGYEIEASVDEDDSYSDFKDITGIKKTNNNEVTKIKPDDIEEISDTSVKYWPSDSATKTSTVTFSKNIPVIYNGRYLGTVADYADYLDINCGNLVFISNDGDSKPDVVFVNDCEVFAVSSSGTDSATKLKKIYTLYGGGDILVPDKGTIIKINNKGSYVNPGDNFSVAKYDIINLYRSIDGEVFDMTVTRNKVSGTISEIGSDGSITIKNKEYKIAYNFDNYNGEDKPTFKINSNANVYVDTFGQIAAAENVSATDGTNVNIGYVIKAGKGSDIDAQCEISIYGMIGKTGSLIYPIASKVKIDGQSYSNSSEVLNILKTAAGVANDTKLEKHDSMTKTLSIYDYNQLIKYTLNSKNEIDTIDTVLENASVATDDLTLSLVYPNNSDSRYDGGTWDGRYQYQSGNVFVGEGGKTVMGISSSTKVLVIPEDLSDKDKYRVTTYSYFSNQQYYRVEGYSFNSTSVAPYVIVYAGKDATDFTYNSDIAIAKMVTQAASDTSSETEDKLTGWNFKTGAEITNLRSEETGKLYGKISAGEIFRYTLDNGKVDKIEMVLENGGDGIPVLFGDNKNMNALSPVDTSDEAKEQRTVQYDAGTRSASSSLCKLMYGTVLAKNPDTNTITITSTVYSDTCGVDDTDKQLCNVDSSTKYFVIDFTQGKEENIVSADATFDEIRSLNDVEGDVYDASQVLLLYNAGKIKTVVIVKGNYGVG